MTRKVRKPIGQYAVFLLLMVGALIMLFPIAWMLSMAVKSQSEIYTAHPSLFPKRIVFDNFVFGWKSAGFSKFFFNSLSVTSVRVFLTVIINAMAGFAFGKYKFKGRTLSFMIILSAMMIPEQVRMIPLYSLMKSLKLVDSYASVIFPALGATFGTFLMRQYVQTIPDELIEASRIDGCSEFKIFYRIVLPLAKPALVTNLLFQFMWGWNDLLYPLLFLQSQDKYTVQLALAAFRDSDTVTTGPIMAMSLLSITPILVLFFLLQRYFVEGIATQGIKG